MPWPVLASLCTSSFTPRASAESALCVLGTEDPFGNEPATALALCHV